MLRAKTHLQPLWLLLLLLSLPVAGYADNRRGEQLHAKHCSGCHARMFGNDGNTIYTRPDRRVDSMTGLHKQIRTCVHNLGFTWFDDEIEDVANYLNQHFYQFSQ